jgi:hypothetical protein
MRTVVLSHARHATVFNCRFLEYAKARGFAAVAYMSARATRRDASSGPSVRPRPVLRHWCKALAERDGMRDQVRDRLRLAGARRALQRHKNVGSRSVCVADVTKRA